LDGVDTRQALLALADVEYLACHKAIERRKPRSVKPDIHQPPVWLVKQPP
jgi:hypothetical protein